jgi:molybdate transport system regulatory protein
MKLDGRFWLTKDGESFLGSGRIELLKRIEATDSMNAAAKEMKMSYKAAWERVNSMNELAENPLIERKTGGKGGGGTKLTPYAYEIIETYEKLDALHRKFIERFSEASDSPEHLAKILNRLFLTTSARNQLLCKITEIVYDNIYARVIMQLNEHQKITSTITATSMKELNLHVGDDVYAIIKSSDVLVSSRLSDFEGVSGMNILQTELMCVQSNDTQSELRLKLSEKKELVAMINYEESKDMDIHNKLYVSIAYKNIIIGT